MGLTFRVSDYRSRASFVIWIPSLGSRRVPGLGSCFSDMSIKSALGRHIFQSLTKVLVYQSINYFILCKGVMQEIDRTNRTQLIPLLYSIIKYLKKILSYDTLGYHKIKLKLLSHESQSSASVKYVISNACCISEQFTYLSVSFLHKKLLYIEK